MGVCGRVSREDVAAAIMRRSAGREGGEIAVRITEPRTRRGALVALSTLGETYIMRVLPRPRRSSKRWFGENAEACTAPVLRLYCACLSDKRSRVPI